jgi:hypothetical protein
MLSGPYLLIGEPGAICSELSRKKHVHLGELVRRTGVIAKTTTEEDAMHPTIIMALAEERIADWTRVQPTATRERRPRRRLRLVWATR